MMNDLASKYIGIGGSGKLGLMNFYNENCARFVKPSRRYHIKDGDNWCAMFTSVIAYMYGRTKEDFPFEVSVGSKLKYPSTRGYIPAESRIISQMI